MSFLRADNLACIRGQRRLFSDLSFTVKAGEVWQLMGANGTGKTSLLRIICGLAEAETGTLYWGDELIQDCRESFYQNLLYIGHKAAVNGNLTAQENIAAWCELQGITKSPSDIEQAIIKVGLYGREDIAANRLSAGQHRRVALARLLLSPAKLWILDEPFTAIDVKAVAVMQQWFAEHLAGGGMILFTSHQPVDQQLLAIKTMELSHD